MSFFEAADENNDKVLSRQEWLNLWSQVVGKFGGDQLNDFLNQYKDACKRERISGSASINSYEYLVSSEALRIWTEWVPKEGSSASLSRLERHHLCFVLARFPNTWSSFHPKPLATGIIFTKRYLTRHSVVSAYKPTSKIRTALICSKKKKEREHRSRLTVSGNSMSKQVLIKKRPSDAYLLRLQFPSCALREPPPEPRGGCGVLWVFSVSASESLQTYMQTQERFMNSTDVIYCPWLSPL